MGYFKIWWAAYLSEGYATFSGAGIGRFCHRQFLEYIKHNPEPPDVYILLLERETLYQFKNLMKDVFDRIH